MNTGSKKLQREVGSTFCGAQVLTAGENADSILSSGLSNQDFEDFQRIWVDDLQMRLARLSTHGRRIMVSGSGHDVPSDRPDSIVNAVREIRAAATTLN
jgi:hypothetical protein